MCRFCVRFVFVVSCLLLTAAGLRAQLPAEFQESRYEEPRRFLGLIGAQVTTIGGSEAPTTNGALVFSGYTTVFEPPMGAGIGILAGTLGRRDMIHVGLSAVRYFGDELGKGLFVQANAGVAQFYEDIIAFNSPPELSFGAYVSAGYSLIFSPSLPGIQVGVCYGFYPASGRTYTPVGLQFCAVF